MGSHGERRAGRRAASTCAAAVRSAADAHLMHGSCNLMSPSHLWHVAKSCMALHGTDLTCSWLHVCSEHASRLTTWYCVVNRGRAGRRRAYCCGCDAPPYDAASRILLPGRETGLGPPRFRDFRITGTVWTPEASFACLLAPPGPSLNFDSAEGVMQSSGFRGSSCPITMEIRLCSPFEESRNFGSISFEDLPRHLQRFRHLISWRPPLSAPPTAICTTTSLK